MHRRTFLKAACASGGIAAQARGAAGSLRLGFDSYSLRAFGWKAIEYLDYAAGLGLDTVNLSDLSDYESLETGYLRKVKEHSERLGIVIDGGIGCICPTSGNWRKQEGDPVQYLLRGLRVSKAVGSTCVRCFMGGGGERRGSIPLAGHIENTVKVLRSVRSQALDLGVKIAVENHGDLQAWELRGLIEESGKDFVGACLDTGNPIPVVEDPNVTLEVLAPYVVTTHVRDSAVYEHSRGAAMQWVALGEGSVDFGLFFERFRRSCPNVGVQLEILTGSPPRVLPYLDPEFWKAFPQARAEEFARFAALARRGRPFMGSMVIAGSRETASAYESALKQQQRIDLERSFEYARKVLKLGVRGGA